MSVIKGRPYQIWSDPKGQIEVHVYEETDALLDPDTSAETVYRHADGKWLGKDGSPLGDSSQQELNTLVGTVPAPPADAKIAPSGVFSPDGQPYAEAVSGGEPMLAPVAAVPVLPAMTTSQPAPVTPQE